MVLRVPNTLPQAAESLRAASTSLDDASDVPKDMFIAASGAGIDEGLERIEDTWGIAMDALAERLLDFADRVDHAHREFKRLNASYS